MSEKSVPNKALTADLLKWEIKKMMERIAKADRRLAGNIVGIVGQESEQARKDRLLAKVAEKMAALTALSVATPTA